MNRMFYDMYELDGKITKGDTSFIVPINNSIAPHFPLPSECDKWIKQFEALRDNFTDEEINEINERYWYDANEGILPKRSPRVLEMEKRKNGK